LGKVIDLFVGQAESAKLASAPSPDYIVGDTRRKLDD
jgi:hypothetical protein